MHVCLLTSGRYPGNDRDRVRRHAETLYRAGHAVTVCARGAAGQPEYELRGGIDIERIPDESLYAGVGGKLDGARYALRFVRSAWLRAATEVHDQQALDVCSVRDLSLVKTGLKLGNDLDVPVVCDLPSATAAVDENRTRDDRFRRVAHRVLHSSWRRNRLVKKALPDADRLVTTCEEARAEYVREKGIDPATVRVVRDTVVPGEISHPDPDTALGLGFDPDEAFVVTAFADGTRRADLETLVEAAARAADRSISLRLLVVGDLDRDTLDDLETRARRRLAGGRVIFRTETDRRTRTDRRTEYLAASDVCLVPPVSRGAETAMPTVIYEAMAAGVPVVAADGPPVRRVVTGTNAGRVVPFRTGSLANALVALSDPDTHTELGANGRRAAETELHPDRDADRLEAVYESVVAGPRESGPASRFTSAIRYEPTS